MRATMSYTLLRLALFAFAFGVLYLVGARGLLLLVLAAVISMLTSFVLLARQREAMAGSISRQFTHFRQRLDEGSRAEDVD